MMDEIRDMQSPISRRQDIRANLDEMEEYFFNACTDYRTKEQYDDFLNYKEYYEDAKQDQQEKEFERQNTEKSKVEGRSSDMFEKRPQRMDSHPVVQLNPFQEYDVNVENQQAT